MLPAGLRPATSWVHYTTAVIHSSAPEDGRNHRPKHVELIGIIVASSWSVYHLYQWCTVKQISKRLYYRDLVTYDSGSFIYWLIDSFMHALSSLASRGNLYHADYSIFLNGSTALMYRGADKSLARPDWKNNWKFAIFLPTRRALLPRRPGWTDNILNFFFWLACKS
jgi:hypothetical protein